MTLHSVCVIGAGAIGGLCAGHLSRVADVYVVTRRKEQAEALNRDGLRISGKSEIRAHVSATTDPTEVPDMEVVIVATKGTSLPEVASALEGRFPNTVVMTVQNGLGAERMIAARGDWPIVSGVTFMSGTRESDTHVQYELNTPTWIGPYHESAAELGDAEAIGELFAMAGLVVKVLPDVRPAQWSKLLFNAAISSVAVLTELPHIVQFSRRDRETDLGHVVFDLIKEGKAVAAAAGVELLVDPWQMNLDATSLGVTQHSDYAHVPSMLVDVRDRRRTEIDYILGPIVQEGKRLGVPVPVAQTVYRLVRGRDRSWDD